MDVIIDANVLFSALIKTGITSRLLFDDRLKLFAPGFLFEELERHKSDVLDRSIIPEEYFFPFLNILKRRISIIPDTDFVGMLQRGIEISPDPKDHVYFALALKLNCGIWTQEKAAKLKQDQVPIYDTNDILAILET